MQALLRFFFTGVATLLPFVVTVFMVSWIVRIADAYVGPSSTFGAFLVTISGTQYRYSGYLVGYLVVVVLLILLGFLVNRATVARFHRAVDRMFARIPLFGKIYATVGQMVEIFGKKGQTGLDRFGGVGQARMGNVKVLALLTSPKRYLMADGREHFLVFVPNSPIPATGFNVFVPADDFELLDMAVEDLAKVLMSLGLLASQALRPPVQPIPVTKVQDGPEIAR